MNDRIVTTISASGEAKTNYELAKITISTFVEDISVDACNLRLQNKITFLHQILESILEKYETQIIIDSMQTEKVSHPKIMGIPNRGNIQDGYKSVYTLSFIIDKLQKISQIYNELCDIHETVVDMPVFSLKNPERLNKKALKNAWQKASDIFSEECKVFGLNPESYEIDNWEVIYPKINKFSMKKTVENAVVDQEEQDIIPVRRSINIDPGMAKIDVNLKISFAKKIIR